MTLLSSLYSFANFKLAKIKSSQIKSGCLVGCIEDLHRFSCISATSGLGSRRKHISEVQVARRGIEPRPLALQAKSLITRPPLFLITRVVKRQQSSLNKYNVATFSVCDSKFKVNVTRSKIMVCCERSCHKKYTCEI